MICFSRLLVGLGLVLAATPAAARLPSLLPLPAELHAGQGSVTVGRATRIVVPDEDTGARNAAGRLVALVDQSRGPRLANGGAKQIPISVRQIPFKFQVGKHPDGIECMAPDTPEGKFVVHADKCEGLRLAVLPLAPAVANPGPTRLVAPTAPRAGSGTLCVTYTAKGVDPLRAIDSVELVP